DPDLRPHAPEHNPDAVRRVAGLLDTLTPLQREVVQLKANGLKHKEIGAILWPEEEPERAKYRSMTRWRTARARLRGEPTPGQINHRKWPKRRIVQRTLASSETGK